MNARKIAYETLMLCEKEHQFSNLAVNNGIKRYALTGHDRVFYTRLVYGVIEKKLTLDYLIRQYIEKSVNRLDQAVLLILRLSFYQLYFCDKIPESAVVSESMKLAGQYASRAKGFINAILRHVCREKIPLPQGHLADIESLSVAYSISLDICRLLTEQYPDQAQAILAGYQTNPAVSINVNVLKNSRDAFLTQFPKALPCRYSPTGARFSVLDSDASLPFLKKGLAFVQDEASQLAVMALAPEPGMRVIDVCACPGGKSFAAANQMATAWRKKSHGNDEVPGEIISMDLHENKLTLIKNGAARLGYTMIRVLCHDGRQSNAALIETADRVICDVPCSGLGVLAKKPEIRYKPMKEIRALPALQYEILSASSRYLKVDGILVYSTCTVNQEENEAVVHRFLQEHSDFTFMDFSFCSTRQNEQSGLPLSSEKGCLTLFPDGEHDGFFIAKLKKVK